MISYLSGEIIDLEPNKITLLTNAGVGYDVGISDISFLNLKLNTTKKFYIYHHITEGNQSLFGFLEKIEKQLFEELIKISGVGGKVAILILGLGVNTLSDAINNKDKKIIESVKGIGKKMAEKIIIELKDKDFIKNNIYISSNKENITKHKLERNLEQDIISTLTNMGYSKQAIEKAINKIPDNLKTTEKILPALIKEL